MRIPVENLIGTVRAGASAKRDIDVPVRVAVFLDQSATPFLIDTVRHALVPQTTSGLVRVDRLSADAAIKPDTDVAIVLTGGSEGLQEAVQRIVIAGAPTVVIAESSVEAPFIEEDTPMLGLIAATDPDYLLARLAAWILERSDKEAAFAANFSFMRQAAAGQAIVSSSLANAATGALVFIPGADLPVMTATQLGMMVQLATMYGKPLRAERGYEAAGVVAGALVLRTLARQLVKRVPGPAGILVRAAVGGVGTYAMGEALRRVYESDIDYTRANEAVARVVDAGKRAVKGAVHLATEADEAAEGAR